MPAADVHLRPVTVDNLDECLALQVDEDQMEFVASNAKSLAEASVDPALQPLAIYDGAARGHERPDAPLVGFAMYELRFGVGFIVRIMIDRSWQREGYGRAAVIEIIRRLKLHPEIELIATSHKRGNIAASSLFRSLGFVPWDIEIPGDLGNEIYLKLDERSSD